MKFKVFMVATIYEPKSLLRNGIIKIRKLDFV